MPWACNWVLIGGETLASEPVTRWPSSLASTASEPIKVPQIPRIWMCMGYLKKRPAGARKLGRQVTAGVDTGPARRPPQERPNAKREVDRLPVNIAAKAPPAGMVACCRSVLAGTALVGGALAATVPFNPARCARCHACAACDTGYCG